MKNYKLVWEETFESNKINKDNWSFSTGRGFRGWGNSESQYYTERNIRIEDNILTIVGLNETADDDGDYHREGGLYGFDYTSAKITTKDKVSFKYGYFEVEALVPKGSGSWPAIWFMPCEESSWPLCGEIDLMEHVGKNQNVIHHSLHTGVYNFQNNDSQYTLYQEVKGVSSNFVKYGMEWTKDYFEFFVDGKSVGKLEKGQNDRNTTVEGWPFDKEFYLIINLAIGGHWGGAIDPGMFPLDFKVRNIKYYK
jgi:beta-glucanase (GH16 family)